MKSLFALLFLFISGAAQAQDVGATPIAAGHWQISGGASLSDIGDKNGSSLVIFPRAEYFVCDHMSLGAGLGMYFEKNVAQGRDDFGLRYTEVGPSATLYFSTSTVAPYITQQVNFGFGEYSSLLFNGLTGAGVALFLNPHIAISPELDARYGQERRGDLSLNFRIAAYL